MPAYSMTKPQWGHFWKLWSRIESNLKKAGLDAAEIKEERHSIIAKAIGKPTHITEVTRDQFTAVKKQLMAVIDPSDLQAQLDDRYSPRSKKIYVAKKAAEAFEHPEEYLATLAAGPLFDTNDWTRLPDDKLLRFVRTVTNRARSKKARTD